MHYLKKADLEPVKKFSSPLAALNEHTCFSTCHWFRSILRASIIPTVILSYSSYVFGFPYSPLLFNWKTITVLSVEWISQYSLTLWISYNLNFSFKSLLAVVEDKTSIIRSGAPLQPLSSSLDLSHITVICTI